MSAVRRSSPRTRRGRARRTSAAGGANGQTLEEAPCADPSGRFTFEGLEPGSYRLKISSGTDERGRELYVERKVSLWGGDVTLSPEEIASEEFVLAMLRRAR
jgi:hypothetical protein